MRRLTEDGKTIRNLLRERNMTIGDLEKESGVSRKTIYRYMHGDIMKPKDRYIENIAEVLEVEPEEICGGSMNYLKIKNCVERYKRGLNDDERNRLINSIME